MYIYGMPKFLQTFFYLKKKNLIVTILFQCEAHKLIGPSYILHEYLKMIHTILFIYPKLTETRTR